MFEYFTCFKESDNKAIRFLTPRLFETKVKIKSVIRANAILLLGIKTGGRGNTIVACK